MKGNVILTDRDLESHFFSSDCSIVISVPEIRGYSDSEKKKLIQSAFDMGDTIIAEYDGKLAVFGPENREKLMDFLKGEGGGQ